MQISNAHIIVTGISKGIGEATAQTLLEAGAHVYGWGRTAPNFQHPNLHFFTCDMAKELDVEMAAQATLVKSGNRIDALINNAGYGAFAKIEDMPSDQWLDMFAVNVHGVYYAIKAVLPTLKRQEAGTIINVSSVAGLAGINEASAYCGTKFAVRGIAQSVYQEVKKYGIRITTIFPGSVNTHFFDKTPVKANATMIGAQDIASTILHTLALPDHVCQTEIEIRPLNPNYN